MREIMILHKSARAEVAADASSLLGYASSRGCVSARDFVCNMALFVFSTSLVKLDIRTNL